MAEEIKEEKTDSPAKDQKDPKQEDNKDDASVEKKKTKEEPKKENIVDERGTGGKKISGHIIINDADSDDASWYVCHTTSGHEARVAETLRQRVETMRLEDKIHEILIPPKIGLLSDKVKNLPLKKRSFQDICW
jgi:hypothetical protein